MVKKTAVRISELYSGVLDSLYHGVQNGELNYLVARRLIDDHKVWSGGQGERSIKYFGEFIIRLIVRAIEFNLNSTLDTLLGDRSNFEDIFNVPVGKLQERILECQQQDMTLYEICDSYYVNGDLFAYDLADIVKNSQELQKLCNEIRRKSECNEYTRWRVEITSVKDSLYVYNEGDYRIMQWERYFTNEGKYENPFGSD